eukprot:9314915-Alexandrium_andersonii.AAC.1
MTSQAGLAPWSLLETSTLKYGDLAQPRGDRDAAAAAAVHGWAARRQLVIIRADGPTRHNLKDGAASKLDWAV